MSIYKDLLIDLGEVLDDGVNLSDRAAVIVALRDKNSDRSAFVVSQTSDVEWEVQLPTVLRFLAPIKR